MQTPAAVEEGELPPRVRATLPCFDPLLPSHGSRDEAHLMVPDVVWRKNVLCRKGASVNDPQDGVGGRKRDLIPRIGTPGSKDCPGFLHPI